MEESYKRIVFAKRLKGDIVDVPYAHECRPEICNPESEEMLINEQMLEGPVALRDFYVCRYLQRHHCTPEKCNCYEVMTGACRISGACYAPPGGYSNYDRNNPMTWHANFRANERRAQATLPTQHGTADARASIKRDKEKARRTRARITELVTLLLFSATRQRVNALHRSQRARRAQRDIQTYLGDCAKNHEVVNLLHLAALESGGNAKHRALAELKYDEDAVTRYCRIILKVRKVLQKYHTHTFKVDALTLGVLYEMRQGFKLNHMWVIPDDPFLCFNLPPINDLPHFNLQKKRVTLGQKMIELAFKKALASGDPINEIVIE